MPRKLRSLLFSSALSVLLTSVLLGQDYRARIQGTVTDASQGVVPDANVTLININTGATAVRQSNQTGHYLFDLVEPGTYTVSVEAPGFSKFVREKISLQTRDDV